ncbi:hypothetical protein C7974DRAFT_452620 [Boeremia exigua]|uniref:uncharacterized protein n=1 Tax=Boeremia exigua TaxID=749465 RepID=UPI001E8E6AD5|nr:uncharacterized protein C7974DRAFT_452620 [Boeremia exigua]KAH6633362.1 hypothetical protein C7974DRAFT_452620 [Boeremia exigua]
MATKNSYVSWGDKNWNNPRIYDTVLPVLTEAQRQEAPRNATPAQRDQEAQLLHHSNSHSSVSSLYANPPSPAVSLSSRSGENYTFHRDANLQYHGAYPMVLGYRYGHSVNPRTPPPTLHTMDRQYYQRPSRSTHPSREPMPKAFKVVSSHPVAQIMDPAGSCIPTGELFEYQSEEKWSGSTRGEAKNPLTQQQYEHEIARVEETRDMLLHDPRVTPHVKDGLRQLNCRFRDTAIPGSQIKTGEEQKDWYLPHRRDTTSTTEAREHAETDSIGKANKHAPPVMPKTSHAAPIRFVDFIQHQNAMRTARLSAQDDQRKHDEWRARLDEKDKKLDADCKRLHEVNLRREATASPANKTPSKTTLESIDVAACTETPQKEVADISYSVFTDKAESNAAAVKKELRFASLHAELPSDTKPKTTTVADPRRRSPARKEHGPVKIRNPSVTRMRETLKVLVTRRTPVAKKGVDVKWTSIDFSDDEDWEKVARDEGAEWEILEKVSG